jgi:hypothetical protein
LERFRLIPRRTHIEHFQNGNAWRETDEDSSDLETLLHQLMTGQYSSPVRIVSFNTSEGWSRDVSQEVAEELLQRCADLGEVPSFLEDFLDRHRPRQQPRQLQLPMLSGGA